MLITKAAFAALVILSVAACGGNPAPTGATPAPTTPPLATPAVATTPPTGPTQPPAGNVDICSLLTADELNAATGRTDYAAGTVDVVGECQWNTEGTTANEGNLIIGYINPDVSIDFAKSTFGAGGMDTTVNGHAAFYNPTEGLQTIWVDVGGGKTFTLSFPRSGELDASYAQIAQHLAEIALGRM